MIRALSISGGKDSAAAALHMEELGLEVHARIYMDTGWEHHDTYVHLDLLERRLGPITRLRVDVPILPGYEAEVAKLEAMLGISPSAMVRLCVWKGYFPGQGTRWCTQVLKHVPAARWYAAQADDVESVVGVRRAESLARSRLPDRESMERVEVPPVVRLPGGSRRIELGHVEQWRPLADWSEEEVVRIHQRHGLPLNPLYRRGSRTIRGSQ
jgi:3'-phosphoadenosine 5'-phosphosulfate sulfotransferase (PAPS reductase)/FAD synthetase